MKVQELWQTRGYEILRKNGRIVQVAQTSRGSVRFYSHCRSEAKKNFRLLLPLLVSEEGCELKLRWRKNFLWCVEIKPSKLPMFFDSSLPCVSNTVKQATGFDGYEFIDPYKYGLTTVVFLEDQIRAIKSAKSLLKFVPDFHRFSLVGSETSMYRELGHFALLAK